MLLRLFEIIYPNKCEVIKLPSNEYFYPIFKNGSTSVSEYARQTNSKFLINEQLSKLDTINIVLRDPNERYLSGIKTFVNNTKKENPNLDILTILWAAENYLFLDRHYAPQLSWLINLHKYSKTAKLRLHGMSHLRQFTPLHMIPTNNEIQFHPDDIERIKNNVHNEMYLRLDNLLYNLIGKELTFSEILTHLELTDNIAFQKLQCIALD